MPFSRSLYRLDDHPTIFQETRVIAEVARNLTAEGREVNLWQIMTKVNSTVRENPNSSLARLMHRDGQAVFGK